MTLGSRLGFIRVFSYLSVSSLCLVVSMDSAMSMSCFDLNNNTTSNKRVQEPQQIVPCWKHTGNIYISEIPFGSQRPTSGCQGVCKTIFLGRYVGNGYVNLPGIQTLYTTMPGVMNVKFDTLAEIIRQLNESLCSFLEHLGTCGVSEPEYFALLMFIRTTTCLMMVASAPVLHTRQRRNDTRR